MTVNWLTASQSFRSGSSKSISQTLSPGDRAVGAAVLDIDAVGQQPVEAAVVLDRGWASRCA